MEPVRPFIPTPPLSTSPTPSPMQNIDIKPIPYPKTTKKSLKQHIFSPLKKDSLAYTLKTWSLGQKVLQIQLKLVMHDLVDIVKDTIQALPENFRELRFKFTKVSHNVFTKIQRAFTIGSPPLKGVKNGTRHYDAALQDLNRLKDRLGGEAFKDKEPEIDQADNNKTFFGIPLPAIKDWLRMTVEKRWEPRVFWKSLASNFGVKESAWPSKYEQIHTVIQRLGMITANKERYFDILDRQDTARYVELKQISGMDMHPDQNTPNNEKEYIDRVEEFFTTYYLKAKEKGDEALLEFFQAVEGVCFESRARSMTDHILQQSELANVRDWDSKTPITDVIRLEYKTLGKKLQGAPTKPMQVFDHLTEVGFFNTHFTSTQQSSLEVFQEYALKQIGAISMDPYSYPDFLKMEVAILKASGKSFTKENFIQQLRDRLETIKKVDEIEGENSVIFFPNEDYSGDLIPFSIESPLTQEFIAKSF